MLLLRWVGRRRCLLIAGTGGVEFLRMVANVEVMQREAYEFGGSDF